jgi:serine/threonine-protein kinase HipA
LKNFGIVYDDVLGVVRLAPVYDLVTTTVYVAKTAWLLVSMALPNGPALKTYALSVRHA